MVSIDDGDPYTMGLTIAFGDAFSFIAAFRWLIPGASFGYGEFCELRTEDGSDMLQLGE